jgi:hypothetical protein
MSHDSQPADSSPVTLINVFEVPAGHSEVFIAQWRERAAHEHQARVRGHPAAPRPLTAGPIPARQCRPLGKPRGHAGRNRR